MSLTGKIEVAVLFCLTSGTVRDYTKINKIVYKEKTMAKIQGIAHYCIVQSDMEAGLHFYCDVLGLTRSHQVVNPDGTVTQNVLRVNDMSFVELSYEEEGLHYALDGPQKGYDHACFYVDNLDEYVEKIRALGAPIDKEPRYGKTGHYLAWTHDPDGNRIEIFQYVPGAAGM